MKRIAQWALSLALGGVVLYVLLRGFNGQQTLAAFRHARMVPLLVGFLLMVGAYLLRGARWQIWEPGLSYWDSLRLILIGFMGNNILPARMGEVLRAHCTGAKNDQGRGRTAALASIAAERILDGLVLGLIGLVGMTLVSLEQKLRLALFIASLAFAFLASALVLSTRYHEAIRSRLMCTRFIGRNDLPSLLARKASQLLDGILPLRSLRRLLTALTFTGVIWSIEAACYYCIGQAVWSGMSVRIAIIFLVVVDSSSVIPLTMGGIGTIEAVAFAFLTACGCPPGMALAMVLLQHAGQYIFTTISGCVFYIAGGFHLLPLIVRTKETNLALEASRRVKADDQLQSFITNLRSTVRLKPPQSSEIQLSIVIPAYNEEARLPSTLNNTLRWCIDRSLDFELILVDDGSRDGTVRLGRLLEGNDFRVRTLSCPHMGKGAAVRMGMLNARGRYVLFMDADGATPLEEILKLSAALDAGHDIAIGSRVSLHLTETQVKRSFLRKLIGRTFSLFVRIFAIGGIADTQCGFKMFRREAALNIFYRQKLNGFAFDVEVLVLARRLSLAIAEVPVNWVAQPGSKVNLAVDSIAMLWDIARISFLHRSTPKPGRNTGDTLLEQSLKTVPSRSF